jgi:hypothetical protein
MLENTEGVMKKDNPEKMVNKGTQDTGQINVIEYRRGNEKGQSREIGNIGYKGHRTINVREYRRGGNQEWILQRHWQHWVHTTHDWNIGHTRHLTGTLGTHDT